MLPDQLRPGKGQEQGNRRPDAEPSRIAEPSRESRPARQPRIPAFQVSEERVDGVEQRPDVAEQCRSVWHAHPPKRPHHDRRDVLEGVLGSGEPGRNDHHKKRQCERAQAREHVAVRESTRKTPAQQVDSGVAMMRARLAGEDREQ